jgi:hypothetical protein
MSRTFLGASIILILALAGIAGIRFMTPGGTLLNDLGNLFIGFGFALGLWWSTSPEPNAPKRTRPEHLRRAARALAFTAFAVVLTMWFSGLFSHGLSVWFVSSQLMLEQIAGACAVLSLCGYLAAFAQRIPDRKLVLHTCWAAGIFGMALVSMGVLMAHTAWCSGGWPGHEGVIKLNHVVGSAYFILTLGAWLYGWHLVSLYRRAFRDALAHAVLLA